MSGKFKKDKDHNATNSELSNNRKKALGLKEKFSPDLNNLIRIPVGEDLQVFVTQAKLDKFGEQHFIDKYKRKSKSLWSYM